MFFCCQNLQGGDLLNFLSAIFFGIHMLRTEHISRCTKKENFLALIGYQVIFILQVLFFKTIFTKKIFFLLWFDSDIGGCCVIHTLVHSWRMSWCTRYWTVILDKDRIVGFDCWIPMAACTLHWCIFHCTLPLGWGKFKILSLLFF